MPANPTEETADHLIAVHLQDVFPKLTQLRRRVPKERVFGASSRLLNSSDNEHDITVRGSCHVCRLNPPRMLGQKAVSIWRWARRKKHSCWGTLSTIQDIPVRLLRPGRNRTQQRQSRSASQKPLPHFPHPQSFHGSNSASPAIATANGRKVCNTFTEAAWCASTSGSLR